MILHNRSQSVSKNGAVYSTGSDRPVTLAVADSERQVLTVRRKSHGTYFERDLHIIEIAQMLDPFGTTVREVN